MLLRVRATNWRQNGTTVECFNISFINIKRGSAWTEWREDGDKEESDDSWYNFALWQIVHKRLSGSQESDGFTEMKFTENSRSASVFH